MPTAAAASDVAAPPPTRLRRWRLSFGARASSATPARKRWRTPAAAPLAPRSGPRGWTALGRAARRWPRRSPPRRASSEPQLVAALLGERRRVAIAAPAGLRRGCAPSDADLGPRGAWTTVARAVDAAAGRQAAAQLLGLSRQRARRRARARAITSGVRGDASGRLGRAMLGGARAPCAGFGSAAVAWRRLLAAARIADDGRRTLGSGGRRSRSRSVSRRTAAIRLALLVPAGGKRSSAAAGGSERPFDQHQVVRKPAPQARRLPARCARARARLISSAARRPAASGRRASERCRASLQFSRAAKRCDAALLGRSSSAARRRRATGDEALVELTAGQSRSSFATSCRRGWRPEDARGLMRQRWPRAGRCGARTEKGGGPPALTERASLGGFRAATGSGLRAAAAPSPPASLRHAPTARHDVAGLRATRWHRSARGGGAGGSGRRQAASRACMRKPEAFDWHDEAARWQAPSDCGRQSVRRRRRRRRRAPRRARSRRDRLPAARAAAAPRDGRRGRCARARVAGATGAAARRRRRGGQPRATGSAAAISPAAHGRSARRHRGAADDLALQASGSGVARMARCAGPNASRWRGRARGVPPRNERRGEAAALAAFVARRRPACVRRPTADPRRLRRGELRGPRRRRARRRATGARRRAPCVDDAAPLGPGSDAAAAILWPSGAARAPEWRAAPRAADAGGASRRPSGATSRRTRRQPLPAVHGLAPPGDGAAVLRLPPRRTVPSARRRRRRRRRSGRSFVAARRRAPRRIVRGQPHGAAR